MAMPAQLNQVAKAMGISTDELGGGLRGGTISMDDFMQKIGLIISQNATAPKPLAQIPHCERDVHSD